MSIPGPTTFWTTGSGRVELQLTLADARQGSHQGKCDDDVRALSCEPYIAEQLAQIDPAVLAAELREWGAWSAAELEDHDQNLQRILWLACGDICDGKVG